MGFEQNRIRIKKQMNTDTKAEEIKLLSALMTDQSGGLADLVSPTVSYGDFLHDRNQLCYKGILDITAAGEPLSVSNLFAKVRTSGRVEEGYVRALVSHGTGEPSLVETYAETVRDNGIASKLSAHCNSIKNKLEEGVPAKEVIRYAEDDLYGISDIAESNTSTDISGTAWLKSVLRKMNDTSISKSRFSTGFSSLDRFLDGGLEYGNVDIIAGRTGMGKTSFGLNILCNVAKAGIPSMMVSIEMTGDMIMRKMISSRCKIPEGNIMGNSMTEEELNKLAEFSINTAKDEHKLFVDDKSFNLFDVETSIRQMVRKHGVKFVVVDYIQIIQVGGSDNRYLEIGAAVNKLKELAKRLNIHVMLLSQINRSVEGRTSKRPALSDLSESGKIEETASRVFLIYRDEYYDPDTKDKNIAEISIAKNRVGQTGMARMTFLGEYTLFADTAAHTYE